MEYYVLCFVIFSVAYATNMIYISVFYHRGLTHGAITMPAWLQKAVVMSGPWVMGIDAKAWCTMHRLHHAHSDTKHDPHSPLNSSILKVIVTQLQSYEKIMRGIIVGKRAYTRESEDLDFPVHWVYRKKLWWLPYAIHLALSVALAFALGGWLVGVVFYLGMVSHPIQGWLVNSFGHAKGYQTFDNGDNSRNNPTVAWLTMGEGFQNNHHKFPRSAKFSYKWSEFDMGYFFCKIFDFVGLIKIDKPSMITVLTKTNPAQAV